MKFINQKIDGVYLIKPILHEDERGVFRRSFCKNEFASNGIKFNVAQGNISENFKKNTLRGFHFQIHPSKESRLFPVLQAHFSTQLLILEGGLKPFMNGSPLKYQQIKKKVYMCQRDVQMHF